MEKYAAIAFLALLVTYGNESVLAQSRLNRNIAEALQLDLTNGPEAGLVEGHGGAPLL